MVIDTEIQETRVEIEGSEYAIANKTVVVVERLRDAERCAVKKGKLEYELMLEKLKILLGDKGYRQLFCNGRNENIDRLCMIYNGVLEAFDYNGRAATKARADARREEIADLVKAIEPIATVLNHAKTQSK